MKEIHATGLTSCAFFLRYLLPKVRGWSIILCLSSSLSWSPSETSLCNMHFGKFPGVEDSMMRTYEEAQAENHSVFAHCKCVLSLFLDPYRPLKQRLVVDQRGTPCDGVMNTNG
jgi:hypothetical protein